MDTPLDPESTALLVVDMQNDFCHADGYYGSIGRDVAGFRPAVRGVQSLLRKARSNDVRVIFTQLVHDEQFGAIEDRHALKPRKWSASGRRLVPGSWGADIIEECQPVEGDLIVEKRGYSAFEGTDLEAKLRQLAVRTVVVCGVVTYACVLATAFSAFDKGFDVCIVSDGVGSWSEPLGEGAKEIVELLLGVSSNASEIRFSSAPSGAAT
jgi:nicotinamidase-related amidase